MNILYKTSLRTESYAFLKSTNCYCTASIKAIFSQAYEECRMYDRQLTCSGEIHTDDPQKFPPFSGQYVKQN
jgi:hypothetical protein